MGERRVERVRGTIEFDDGQVCEFEVSVDGSSRWGNATAVLADAVEPCEVMQDALVNNDLMVRDGDDDG